MFPKEKNFLLKLYYYLWIKESKSKLVLHENIFQRPTLCQSFKLVYQAYKKLL